MRYRFGFNGKENDNEVKGTGNQVDFGARIHDPRLGRFLSIDPLAKQFPSESNYSFAGNSPISLVDDLGKKKTYYITKIAVDGSKTTLVVVNKYEVKQIVTQTNQSVGVPGLTMYTATNTETKTYDIAQNITIYEKTGNVSVGKERLAGERDNNAGFRYIEDNVEELGAMAGEWDDKFNGGGGIVFTSSSGQNQETRKGFNADPQVENIDLLMAVIGAATSAASNKNAETFVKQFKQVVEAIQIISDMKNETGKAVSGNKYYMGTTILVPEDTTSKQQNNNQ